MSQCQLEIIARGNGCSSIVFQFETEIPQQPQEGREGIDEFLRVIPILPMQHSCQLDNQTKTVDGLFIDTADAIVDELGAKQQC